MAGTGKHATFIYPKDDWEAAEVVMKIQALLSSWGYRTYATPKNTRRNKDDILNKLRHTKYAIFVAIEAEGIDEDTRGELSFLEENRIPTYYIIPETWEMPNVEENMIYFYDMENPTKAIEEIDKRIKHTKDNAELIGMISIAMVILFTYLLWIRKEG